ncbi:MAG: reverse transcriptase family protein [Paludibacter sp.]|nr:reverse transcriptase family protein [Paludibacter sp.]
MITNTKYLCHILKADLNSLQDIIENIEEYYITWEKDKIDKTTNQAIIIDNKKQTRPINSTKKELKLIQKRIFKFLNNNTTIPAYAFGGVSKKDNVINAKTHQGNKYIFTTDLKSFFPSISHSKVFNLYLELGCTPTISKILTQLTTYKYQLPQGVPTSTILANLIFKSTGDKIQNYCTENNIKFTTFVDDITLSSKIDFKDKLPEIIRIITEDGYRISHKKTFYKTKNPVITGVICQNNRLKLDNSFHKRLSKIKDSDLIDPKLKESKINGYKRYIKRVKYI